MRNKLLLVLLSGLLLILPALGCITDDSKTTASPITTDIATIKAQIAAYGVDIANLKDQIGKKADSTRVDALAGNTGGNTGYSKTETYTQQQVNDAIASAVNALKNDQTWITVSNSSSSSANSVDRGSAISSNGDLELWLEKDVDSEVYISNLQAETWFLTVKNKGNSGTYYRINANFDLSDATPVQIDTAPLTVANSTMVLFTPSTTLGGATVSGIAYTSSQAGGTNKVYIGKNSSISLVVVLTVDYSAVTGKLWTWDFSIRQLN
jgi:hypothetical protein